MIKPIILEVHGRVIPAHACSGLIFQHAMGSFRQSIWPWGQGGVPPVSQQRSCRWLVSTHLRVNQVYYNWLLGEAVELTPDTLLKAARRKGHSCNPELFSILLPEDESLT